MVCGCVQRNKKIDLFVLALYCVCFQIEPQSSTSKLYMLKRVYSMCILKTDIHHFMFAVVAAAWRLELLTKMAAIWIYSVCIAAVDIMIGKVTYKYEYEHPYVRMGAPQMVCAKNKKKQKTLHYICNDRQSKTKSFCNIFLLK